MRELRARRASKANHRSWLLRPFLAHRGIPPVIRGVLQTRRRRVRRGIGQRLRRSPVCPRLGGIIRFGPTRRILLLAVDRRRRQPIRVRRGPPSGNRRLDGGNGPDQIPQGESDGTDVLTLESLAERYLLGLKIDGLRFAQVIGDGR